MIDLELTVPVLQIAQCVNTGDLRSIFHVKTGGDCDCVVPGTKIPVVAKNAGKTSNQILGPKQKRAHFAIANNYDVKSACESALHQLAKEVFMNERKLKIPVFNSMNFIGLRRQVIDNLPKEWDGNSNWWIFGHAESQAKRLLKKKMKHLNLPAVIHFDSVELEIPYKVNASEIRVDAVGVVNGVSLLVEFKVTHAVDNEKKKIIAKLGHSCLEIDLSEFHQLDSKGDVNYSGMREILLGRTDATMSWLHNKKMNAIKGEIIDETVKWTVPVIKRKLIKDKRERDSTYFKQRKQLGFKPKKVYGNVSNFIYCPLKSGVEISLSSCRKCRFFGEHFYFVPKKLIEVGDFLVSPEEVQLVLCGFDNKISKSKLQPLLKKHWEKEI
jgi:hypothetical protein